MTDIEARLAALEKEVARLRDADEIRNLQKIYGYYLEHWETDKIAELFSDEADTSVEIANNGIFIGKSGVLRFFGQHRDPPPEFLHVMMQVNDVVTVDPGGTTAKGRWYGFGALAMPLVNGTTQAVFSNGVYENEYVKQDGVWKIHKMHWYRIFFTPYEDGWVKTPVVPVRSRVNDTGEPDRPAADYLPYPAGVGAPCHFKHPVTGK